jgi:hypothetical protein
MTCRLIVVNRVSLTENYCRSEKSKSADILSRCKDSRGRAQARIHSLPQIQESKPGEDLEPILRKSVERAKPTERIGPASCPGFVTGSDLRDRLELRGGK